MRMKSFKIKSNYTPSGDQPTAIDSLVNGVTDDQKHQTLLGVTGSGKTFTMAKIIESTNKTTLIMAPNKTLAAQLYTEMRDFFPSNSVEYFVSYYDYYQPEAYVPVSDTYIAKDASLNEHIEQITTRVYNQGYSAGTEVSSEIATYWRNKYNGLSKIYKGTVQQLQKTKTLSLPHQERRKLSRSTSL